MESDRRRERFPWLAIWKTGDELPYSAFEAGLPRFVRDKNDLLNCTMDHVDRCEDSLAVNRHKMRCIVTKCASQRCKDAEESCRARYKILKCTEVDYVVIFEQGEHCMAIDAPPSPLSSPELTTEMKDYIVSKLEDAPSMVAQLTYSFLSREINSGRTAGQAPALEKVQNFVKTWRSKNKPDRMEPVLEICRQSMYDGGAARRTSESLLVFCDTQVVDGAVQPALRTGSAANPFRIGLTCMALLESYVNVQRDPTLSTLLHLDSTHSIVKQKYPVFVVGISDRSGSFMPVVYYCTSLRNAHDIRWCLGFLKRVILHEFGLIFSPDFVMMDADKTQYKACEQELQSTKVLMCWFHVTQNVHKHVDAPKLSGITRKKIFRDLYDLHFAETEDDYLLKREFVVRSWRGAGALCPRVKRVTDHLLKIWILGARFARWQAFYTPTGYASTNNPLETYHYSLKLANDNKRATPSELVSGLDLSRLGYVSSMSGFDNVPTVSKRLKAAFNRAEKLKELRLKWCTSIVWW